MPLRSSRIFIAFGDYAGLTSPTVAEALNPSQTPPLSSAGDRDEYNEHDPLWLFSTRKFPDLAGWFEVGLSDSESARRQRTLVPLGPIALAC
jgi:hypothetical protein